jgi:hypothetical protein
MKVTEVMQKSDDALLEAFNREGTNGFLAEDLVKVVRAHQDETQWSEALSCEDMIALMERDLNGGD